ncbi:hypothetical protein LTR17_022691 [Elasticomyces elasticus]|nr:hypothetical protein LTR17_022691 [Elasticomyces elasticus]
MSDVLEAVEHLLVTPENPPQDVDGMDHERCAALHNAILKYGWVRSGRDADDFDQQSRPWLELHPLTAEDDFLHPSILDFFRSARALLDDQQVNLFYNVWGINHSPRGHEYCFPDEDQSLLLYGTHPSLASQIDGLVYDQGTHKAIMHFDITDELDPEQPWQPLESILTAWIEMIQRCKVVALPDDVGTTTNAIAEGGGILEIPGPRQDPLTGAKRRDFQMKPWTIVPWTPKDLEESVELWGMLVKSIEQKMGLEDSSHAGQLLDAQTLDSASIPDGFARKFLSQVARPRFEYIAPGLRVPTAEDFIFQPFIDANWQQHDEDDVPAILLFRGDPLVDANELTWIQANTTTPQCPCGVYLSPCDKYDPYPQQDGFALILPFDLNSGWAKKSDYGVVQAKDHLYQSGVNPYNPRHPAQLQAFLENAYLQLQDGHWGVDRDGVTGGLDLWKEADTAEKWSNYAVQVGPSRYWRGGRMMGSILGKLGEVHLFSTVSGLR